MKHESLCDPRILRLIKLGKGESRDRETGTQMYMQLLGQTKHLRNGQRIFYLLKTKKPRLRTYARVALHFQKARTCRDHTYLPADVTLTRRDVYVTPEVLASTSIYLPRLRYGRPSPSISCGRLASQAGGEKTSACRRPAARILIRQQRRSIRRRRRRRRRRLYASDGPSPCPLLPFPEHTPQL